MQFSDNLFEFYDFSLFPYYYISIPHLLITVDFGEVKTAPTEFKEKCFQMMSSAYRRCSKAPQNVLMLSEKEVR